MGIIIGVERFDGKRYAPDEDYLDMKMFTVGGPIQEWPLALPDDPQKYRVEIFNGAGRPRVTRGFVKIDGKEIAKITAQTRHRYIPLTLDASCHKLTAEVTGPEGATVWVFIAEASP